LPELAGPSLVEMTQEALPRHPLGRVYDVEYILPVTLSSSFRVLSNDDSDQQRRFWHNTFVDIEAILLQRNGIDSFGTLVASTASNESSSRHVRHRDFLVFYDHLLSTALRKVHCPRLASHTFPTHGLNNKSTFIHIFGEISTISEEGCANGLEMASCDREAGHSGTIPIWTDAVDQEGRHTYNISKRAFPMRGTHLRCPEKPCIALRAATVCPHSLAEQSFDSVRSE
jgi:hypothetical protein